MLFRGEFADFGPNALQVAGVIVDPLIHLNVSGLGATSASQTVWIADAAYELVAVREVHGVASSSGTLMVEKCTGTTAPGSGTVLLSATVNLAGTANTVASGALVTTTDVKFAAGDRLSFKFAGTMTSLAGCAVSLCLKKI